MKKCIAILLMVSTSVWINANSPQVFIKNNYGAELAYNFNNQEGLRLPNGKTEPLGDANTIYKLEIRTTGWGSSALSSFDSLMPYVEKIKKSGPSQMDVVLLIDSSGSFSGWNIDPVWVVKEAVANKFNERSDWRMMMIKQGMLGKGKQDFVHKICSADYSKAIKEGKTNLCEYLNVEIKNTKIDSLGQLFDRVNKVFTSMKSFGYVK